MKYFSSKVRLVILGLTLGGMIAAGFSVFSAPGTLLGDTIASLPVFTSTSSPFNAITTRTHGTNIYAPYSKATTSDFAVTHLTNCDTIDTDSNGNLKCGSDATGGGGSGGAGFGQSWEFPSGI